MELNYNIIRLILEDGASALSSRASSSNYLNFINTPLHKYNFPQITDSMLNKVKYTQETSSSISSNLLLEIVSISNLASSQQGKEASSRCLLFELTDGVSLIKGIEHTFLNEKSEITLGSKVLILGPTRINRGVMLLRENNFLLLSSAKSIDT